VRLPALLLILWLAPDAGTNPPMPPAVPAVPPGPSAAEILRGRAEAFGKFHKPVTAPPTVVGGYSNGCLLGSRRLPSSGPGFELLHLERRRYFGHPSLIDYVRRLARATRRAGLPPLLIGDLSQVRGGPTLTGHRSHQTGLDVDIGFTAPPWLSKRKLTRAERETLFPPAVLDLKTGALTSAWNAKVAQLIAMAAQDPAVNRIFVHPGVKRQLCLATQPGKRPPWLRLVRPWWGHHDHLHVRLSCPPDSATCAPQEPLRPGDGCDELAWWFSADAQKARTARPELESAEPRLPAPMPPACEALISDRMSDSR
jgi:penicillin-insensitive murein endopeptidase